MPHLAQILYSGLGGHGDVAFGITAGDRDRVFSYAMGFLGIEPLLPAYAEKCKNEAVAYRYLRAVSRKPWLGWPGVYAWLRATKPDFLILHSPTALLPCLAYARTRRIPLVMVEHQPNVLKKRSEWVFSRLGMASADCIVALTPQYLDELRSALGAAYRPEKVRLIANGISVQAFSGRIRSLDRSNTITIGMAARFTKLKRFDLAVDMLAALIKRRPNVEWRVTLAGGGEEWEAVRARAATFGLSDRIDFPGVLGKPELARWMRDLDVYVHLTEGEAMSISILQAMASALPIAASRVPGVDAILDNVEPLGRLVAAQTGDAFAAAVISFVDEPEEAAGMGQRARQACVERYSDTRMFDAYRTLLNEIGRP
jgi:glycosyltransferase involved in cell wall biosynthesis